MSTNALSKMNKADMVERVSGVVPVLTFDWSVESVAGITVDEFDARAEAIRETAGNVDGMLTVFSSQETYAAKFLLDQIGKGKRFEKAGDYAKHIGVSGSQVTRLTRLGRAIMVHDIKPTFSPRGEDPTLWQSLTRVVNDSEAVRKLLDSDDPCDHEVLADAIANHNKIEAESAAAKEAADKANGTTGPVDTGESKAESKASNADLFTVLHNRLAAIKTDYTPERGQDFLSRAVELVEKAQDIVTDGEAEWAQAHPDEKATA